MILCEEFEIKTGGRLDSVDVTEEVRHTLHASGLTSGSVLVFSPHTTCCVIVGPSGGEMERALEATMAAIAAEDDYYAHDDLTIRTENLMEEEPPNAPAHILHAIAGKASECIPFADGELLLGEDQRILFVELDNSRLRRYLIQILGE